MPRNPIRKWFGKGKKKDASTTSPLFDASSSQAAPVDDTTPTLPAPPYVTHASKEKIGLFELSKNESEKTVDVVAVHGLQGDAYKTWEHDNGSLWLRDFLPADIPNARIMTFGYDSTVAFSKSVAKIEDKALELLNHLSARRYLAAPGKPARPIVFICHSLGGIVVKKALVLAHDRNSNLDYKDISANTKAIAFLGVPHEGSNTAWWAGFATNLLKSFSLGTSTNTAIVSDLEKGSATLADISRKFVEKAPDMIVYTFYERERLHGIM
ncbi:hypothetical protein MMC31_002620, partial [Peltigera leucophlebia]|nr:hypothetical protein [Peltigera leucophlebia]